MLKVIGSIRKNLQSYNFAIDGLKDLMSENNFKIQLMVASITIILGVVFKLSYNHWVVIFLCIGIVLALEAINTAMEVFCNHMHPEKHVAIGRVKDISAAAVLISAVTSAIIGCLIFWQYF